MNHSRIISLTLVVLILTACFEDAVAQPPPPWALGDRLYLTGTLVDWATGHGILPTDGELWGEMNAGNDEGEYGELIAVGHVRPDASFEFSGLCRGSETDMGCIVVPVAEALCGGLTTSEPRLNMALIGAIHVPGLAVSEPPPPRPKGWVYISTEKPKGIWHDTNKRAYTFAYADRDAKVKGSCVFGLVDLDLHKGWNSLKLHPTQGVEVKTAAIPADAKWWFFNAYTMDQ